MMRVAQIIDSLDIGGAEKMAVNYANALYDTLSFSALVTTRKEGPLKAHLHPNVSYFYMQRSSKLDLRAIMRLRSFCKKHKINYLQAHSSSFFTAFLLKLTLPSIQIIWHDHNGMSEFIGSQKTRVIWLCSHFFRGIVVVNFKLKDWAERTLSCKNVRYLPNFTTLDFSDLGALELKGTSGKRIVCLANLRFQKNHFLLLEVAEKMQISHADWTFHLIGKDFEDAYSDQVKAAIKDKQLEHSVFLYGSQQHVAPILKQATIAVLTSQSEGLPVALLEYGLMQLPLVSTAIGEIPLIIQSGENGFLVPNYDATTFYQRLVELVDNPELRKQFGNQLQKTIETKHSEQAIVNQFLNWIKSI
ncbi:glycosyltransferase [Flavobacterium sp.]|uniref:glycosyltransferase n=1 Tax=Flavobacterium sp. TaxID=239 RepID=UPI00263905DC|nr:glycosyltransferase [Flavobacterium sp.]